MNPKHSIRIAGKLYYTNETGRGVFTERNDGTDRQLVGTNDAPRFASDVDLHEWILGNLDTD